MPTRTRPRTRSWPKGTSVSRSDAPNYRDARGGPRCNECRHENPDAPGHCELFSFIFEKGYTCDAYLVPKDPVRQRKILTRQLAHLEALRKSNHAARKTVKDRAAKQLNSMPKTIKTVGDHVRRNKGGGILAFRRYRTLLTERRRLHGIVAAHEAEKNEQ